MVSGFEVLGAISFGIDRLKQVCEVIQNYRSLPKSLVAISGLLEGSKQALKTWMEGFGMYDGQHNRYCEVLFGPEGWYKILRQIGLLDDAMKRVQDVIEEIPSCASRSGRRGLFTRKIGAQVFEDELRHASRHQRRWDRFTMALSGKAEALKGELGDFDRGLRALRRMARGFVQDMHDVDTDDRRERSELLKSGLPYRQARKDAEALHNAFRARTGGGNCYMALELLPLAPGASSPSTKEVDQYRDFQFLLVDGRRSRAVWLRNVESEAGMYCLTNFSRVVDELERKSRCYLVDPLYRRDDAFTIFKVYEYESKLLQQSDKMPPLEKFLKTPSKRRVEVSHRLALALFRIMGSSWGQYLELHNIRAKQLDGHRWALALSAKPGHNNITSNLAECAKRYAKYSNMKMRQHMQIYRLGLVLLQLALRRPIRFITRRDHGPEVVIDGQGPRQNEMLAADVEYETGSEEFGQIVYFCLSVFRKSDLTKTDNLESKFNENVLLPLSDVTKAARS